MLQLNLNQPVYVMATNEYTDIPILQGSVVRKKSGRSKSVHIDAAFQNPNDARNVDAIVFQNYYCSSLSLSQQNSLQEYVTIVDCFVMMEDARSEEYSQSWFTIPSSLFNGNFVAGRPLRFTLHQPDTTWQKFEIQNIRVVTKVEPPNSANANFVALMNNNLHNVIACDWAVLNDAAETQKNIVEAPEITFTLAEYRRSIKKKEKKKEKKGSNPLVGANDDFGIAIPSFPKNTELPDNI